MGPGIYILEPQNQKLVQKTKKNQEPFIQILDKKYDQTTINHKTEDSIQDVLDEREIGNQASVIEIKTNKQPNYDIIKPLYFDDVNIGSEVQSEKYRNEKMTQYDLEKIQLRLEEMKREINEHQQDQQATQLDENGEGGPGTANEEEEEQQELPEGDEQYANEEDYAQVGKTGRVEWPQAGLYQTT